MALNDLNLKKSYDSDEDNLLKDFYIPALKESCLYRRIASYYSSSSLAVAADGIAGLIKNKGTMKLLVNVGLTKQDLEAIEEGVLNPEKVISEMMIQDLEKLKNQLKINHIKALSWLIAKDKLEIKVVVVRNNRRGIMHQKVGLLSDELGNTVAFSGSENETASGFIHNIEEFKVFRSWITEERDYLKEDEKKFDKFWGGDGNRVETYSLPKAIRERLIKIKPQNETELQEVLDCINRDNEKTSEKKLRDYQTSAIESWFDNGRRGIFEMATGSGKTFTAISLLKKISETEKPLLAVIVCPFQHLVTQWIKELGEQNISSIPAFGNKKSWTNLLSDKISDLNSGYENLVVVVTTYNTSSGEDFLNLVKSYNHKSIYIGDEVHYVGAKSRRVGLLENYSMRLGLSATPSRWMDEEGTEIITNYFGDTVFEFGLPEAISKGFLTPYKYYPHIAYLSNNEMEEYESYAPKIARLMQGNREENSDRLSLLLIRRQKIITDAVAKYKVLDEILDSEGGIDKTLIYCSDKQIKKVPQQLLDRKIIFHRFTAHEKNAERKKILTNFDEGVFNVLLAIKCLDEGVDVPSTKTAIILASSGNPREYVQRRGRILRRHPSKEFSVIHDIIILPPKGYFYKYTSSDTDKKMLRKELKRYMEFSESSMNPLHSTRKILEIMEDYNLM
jgi:superfamily II DNA or RNA helicase